MAGPDREYMRARFAEMDVEELRRVVTTERQDYLPAALELAEAELQSRQAMPYRVAEWQAREGVRPSERSSKYIDIYAALMAAGAVGNPIIAILTHLGAVVTVCLVAMGLLSLAVANGLRQRRLWAWRWNWAFMVLHTLIGLNASPLALGWLVANAIYFGRRVSAFQPAKDAASPASGGADRPETA